MGTQPIIDWKITRRNDAVNESCLNRLEYSLGRMPCVCLYLSPYCRFLSTPDVFPSKPAENTHWFSLVWRITHSVWRIITLSNYRLSISKQIIVVAEMPGYVETINCIYWITCKWQKWNCLFNCFCVTIVGFNTKCLIDVVVLSQEMEATVMGLEVI